MYQIELFNHLTLQKNDDVELLVLDSNTWDHLTVCKQMSSYLKIKLPTNIHFQIKYVWTGFGIK